MTNSLHLEPWDSADYLTNDETIAEYLTVSLEEDTPQELAQALGAVARAKGGIAPLAAATGIPHETLQQALSGHGNLELDTVLKVLRAFGAHLSVKLVA